MPDLPVHPRPVLAVCLAFAVSCTAVEQQKTSVHSKTKHRSPTTVREVPGAKVKKKRKIPPLSLAVTQCARPNCPITLVFSRPMVARATKTTPSRLKKQLELDISPKTAFSMRWTTPRRLRLVARKGLDYGHCVELSVKRAKSLRDPALRPFSHYRRICVPYLQMANKVAEWPRYRGRPRLIALMHHQLAFETRRAVGRRPLYALYDQPVSIQRVKRQLKLEDSDGKKVALIYSRPPRRIYGTTVTPNHVVAFRLARLPAHESELSLAVPSWKDGNLSHESYALQVERALDLKRVAYQPSGYYDFDDLPEKGQVLVPRALELKFEFSSSVQRAAFKRALSIKPRPKTLRFTSMYTSVTVSATLEAGRRYALLLGRVQGLLGTRLARPYRRVLKARDLPAQLELPKKALILSSSRPRLPLALRNIGPIKTTLLRFKQSADFIEALADNGSDCAKTGKTSAAHTGQNPSLTSLNKRVRKHVRLPKKPGLYCATVSAKPRGSEAGNPYANRLLQITNIGLTAKISAQKTLVWVTDLKTTRPIAGANVRLFDSSGVVLASAKSDQNGLASVPSGELASRAGVRNLSFVETTIANDSAVLPLRPGKQAQPWQFGIRGAVEGNAPLSASLFTERGVYRPGETVHGKVLLKHAAGKQIHLTIVDPRGQQLTSVQKTLDDFSGAGLSFKLPGTTMLGQYALQARIGTQKTRATFRVAEYRVPSFEVKLVTAGKLRANRTASAIVNAKYFHGVQMPGRKVEYRVTRQLIPFRSARYPGFSFADPGKQRLEVVRQGRSRLGGDSAHVFRFSTSPRSSRAPTRYKLEATVSDVDGHAQTTTLTRDVHPVDFYIGTRPPLSKVLPPKSKLDVPFVVVRPTGQLLAGVPVAVTLQRVAHHTVARASGSYVRRKNRRVYRTVQRCRRVSRGIGGCRLTLPKSGHYRVLVSAGAGKRRAESSYKITVPGRGGIAWPRYDHERIDIIADKASYQAGQTAKLIIQSPFKRARGLLTLEREGVLTTRLFEIKGNTPVLKVPLEVKHAPAVYASVVLLRGRTHHRTDALGFDTGAPEFRIGYATLKIAPAIKPTVSVAAPAISRPASNVTVTIKSGLSGRRSRATVMVVNEAVLALTAYRTPKPARRIWRKQPLAVRSADSRVDMPHARRSRREAIFPGGGGIDYDEGINNNEGDNDDDGEKLRRDFRATAYYNPSVDIDESGTKQLQIKLPDSLTRYRVMVVVSDGKGAVGSAQAPLVTRKPLLVRAVLPRFLHPGDELMLAAQVHNNLEQTASLKLEAAFEGLSPLSGQKRIHVVKVRPGKSAMIPLRVRVTASEKARVRLAVRHGKHRDAVERVLAVYDPGAAGRSSLTSPLTSNATLDLKLPKGRLEKTTRVEVLLSSSTLTRLKSAVKYIMKYPNGCIEQTTSTAYPLVVLEDLLPAIGVDVDRKRLKTYATAGVKRLLSFQTQSGGLSYWPGGKKPHAFGTAFGLTALLEAKQRGYNVPQSALDRMASYLQRVLSSQSISQQMPHGGMADADTRAFIAMTLGRLKRPVAGEVRQLWAAKHKLGGFGLALLAVAAAESASVKTLAKPIVSELRRRAVETANEATFKGGFAGGASFGSATRAHAAALIGFSAAAPKDGFSDKLLRGLLKRQSYGLWGNTQENVFGVMGVVAKLKSGGARANLPKLELRVGGRLVPSSSLGKLDRSTKVLRFGAGSAFLPENASKLTFSIKSQTPVRLLVNARYRNQLAGKQLAARSRGFAIKRRYERLDGRPIDANRIRHGSVVRVVLRVNSKKLHHYVALTDRLPAGLEPINSALATAQVQRSKAPVTAAARRAKSALSYRELRDTGGAFFIDRMAAGDYELSYYARAITRGRFVRPAARIEAMYRPTIDGRTAVDNVVVF
jgi:uncharacterized protein YfaS (alpha-2-macroglobulin family)